MGSCYSKRARGGNSYSTAEMASTKLEDTSRLVRPTPYARNQNANLEFSCKKPFQKNNSTSSTDNSDIKNAKFQSNIPRFNSTQASGSGEQKTIINDNEALHLVNNNTTVSPRAAYNSTSPVSKLMIRESNIKPKSVGSKTNAQDKTARTSPRPGSGILRPLINKFSPSLPKSQLKESKANGRHSRGPSPLSPSKKGCDSRDSLSDFDSGLGNSLTDKQRPEDSDTIKDLEQIEFQDEFSPNINVELHSSTPKQPTSDSRYPLKAPVYKKEPNGKWSFDEQHFGPETVRSSEPKQFSKSSGSSPREKHSFKMSASDNIFSTYASYKGLLSSQKKSFRPTDVKFNSRDKTSGLPSPILQCPSSSVLPQAKNMSAPGSVFYCHNENTAVGKCPVVKSKTESLSKQSSPDSEKSDSTGIMSPPSDDNREFLIDDEISDQPGLTFFNDPVSEDSDVQSLQLAMSELHALQLSSTAKKRTDSVGSYCSRKDHRDSLALGSEMGSSCSSIASDDLMLDYDKTFPEGTVNEGPASPMRKLSDLEVDKVGPLKSEKFDFDDRNRKRLLRRSSGPLTTGAERSEWRQRTLSVPLRPPRQLSMSEADGGGLRLDSSSYRLLCQDLNGVKTLLLRLKSVIQEAETINPFDQANPNNILYHALAQADFPSNLVSPSSVSEEKRSPEPSAMLEEQADLRRQLVLLHQQLQEKDRTVHMLQQQMTKYLNIQPTCKHDAPTSNAATQTERGSGSLPGSLTSSSSEDGSIETLVSAQADFEETFRKKSAEQDLLSEHLVAVVRLLDRGQSDC